MEDSQIIASMSERAIANGIDPNVARKKARSIFYNSRWSDTNKKQEEGG